MNFLVSKDYLYLMYEYTRWDKNSTAKHKLQISGHCAELKSAIERTEEFLNELKEIENEQGKSRKS